MGSRQQTARGAKTQALAALAVVGLALVGCGSSKSSTATSGGASTSTSTSATGGGPGAGKPAVTIGDKNFTEENILGQLYAQALEAKGYKVALKENIGSTEITYKALTSGQIDMYPEYTGVLLSAVAGKTANPASATAALSEARSFVAKDGIAVLEPTPFYDSNVLATLPAYASAHHLSSIADLKPLGRGVRLGGPPEFATRFEGLPGIRKEYAVNPTFVPIAIELSYKALESKQVDVQNVFSTDGQLLSGKFKLLADPKHVFGFQNVAPLVKKNVLTAEGPEFSAVLNRVSALLTIKAIQQMNAAVSIDKQSPAAVAKQFLRANGLS